MGDRELGGLGVSVAAGLGALFAMIFANGAPALLFIVGGLFTVCVAAAAVAFVNRR